jgi:hypothetical protein
VTSSWLLIYKVEFVGKKIPGNFNTAVDITSGLTNFSASCNAVSKMRGFGLLTTERVTLCQRYKYADSYLP